jgi:hypothetical protein
VLVSEDGPMTRTADEAAQITAAALDCLNGVSQATHEPWPAEVESARALHLGAFAEVRGAVEHRLRQLRRGQSEWCWGAALFVAEASLTVDITSGLSAEAAADLRRQWLQLLSI